MAPLSANLVNQLLPPLVELVNVMNMSCRTIATTKMNKGIKRNGKWLKYLFALVGRLTGRLLGTVNIGGSPSKQEQHHHEWLSSMLFSGGIYPNGPKQLPPSPDVTGGGGGGLTQEGEKDVSPTASLLSLLQHADELLGHSTHEYQNIILQTNNSTKSLLTYAEHEKLSFLNALTEGKKEGLMLDEWVMQEIGSNNNSNNNNSNNSNVSNNNVASFAPSLEAASMCRRYVVAVLLHVNGATMDNDCCCFCCCVRWSYSFHSFRSFVLSFFRSFL